MFLTLSLSFYSCKKDKDASPALATGIDKTINLNGYTTSAKDTLFVKRDKSTAQFRLTVKKPAGTDLKRLYVFKRVLHPGNIGNYVTVQISDFSKDGNNNYYFPIPSAEKDTTNKQVTVELRVNDLTAFMDEFYFVYTNDADYAGPTSTAGVVIGPAQFFVVYGKLTEYTGIRIYNSFTTNTKYFPGVDLVNLLYKTKDDAASDKDIYENTDNNALFLGKFKSLNGTSFVKASSSFPYSNATDLIIASAFKAQPASEFTESPDSVKIGDLYLTKLRGDTTKYSVIKILYITPEDGQTGAGHDNEYFLFNIKK
ncbi:MAG: hypothetical protein H7259_00535 [Cytophagales bacterium]|nr:hypothetical protein [Cytophaga sp.]